MRTVAVILLAAQTAAAAASSSAVSLPAAVAASATSSVRDFLAVEGLACCIDVITRKTTWWHTGGGVDSVDDLRFLATEQIERLPIPQVKINVLKSIASEDRERVRRERSEQRRRESWSRSWLESMLAALETLSRGFTLGFGLSFIYESLLLNRDFYSAEQDLVPRVRRAVFRAGCAGVAVAVTLYGSALLVPHSWRFMWLDGKSS